MTTDAQPTDPVMDPPRWRQRRWQLLALALLVGGALGVYRTWFTTKAAPVAPPQQVKATRGTLATTLTTSGTSAAGLSAKVGFQTAGTVNNVSVIVGQTVTAGQELARVDDRDATLRLQTAQASLDAARTRLAQLQAPAVAADKAASAAAVAGATSALANAQAAYGQLLSPTTTDIAAADAAVVQAQVALAAARTNVDSNWSALVSAQNQYCFTASSIAIGYVCVFDQLPLSASAANDVTNSLRLAGGNATVLQRATGLLQASTAYLNSKQTLDASQAAYNSAKAKRDALGSPTASEVSQARASLAAAQANLASAQAKQQALTDGATSFDLDLQRASVRQAEIAVQQAVQTLDNTVLRAPFGGQVAAIGFNLGEQSGAGTITINDPTAVRVDLTVSETDLPSLKVGQFGLATFDALPGQQVVVRVRGISTLPTVTQGVVTYPVQAEILTGQALADARTQLQALLQSTGTRGAAGGAGGGGPQGAGSPQAGPSASATASPNASSTTGGDGAPTGTFTPGGAGSPGGRRGPGGQNDQATPGTPAAPGAAPATPGAPGQGGQRGTGGGLGAGAATAARVSPGMNASITLLLQVQENVLLLPTAAVHRQGRQSFVTVPDGTTTKELPVVVGGTDSRNVIIASGLDEGATVLIGVTPATGSATPARSATAAPPIGGGGGGFGGGGVR